MSSNKKERPEWGKNSKNVQWRLDDIKECQDRLDEITQEAEDLRKKIKTLRKQMYYTPFQANDVLTNKEQGDYSPVGSILLKDPDDSEYIGEDGFLYEAVIISEEGYPLKDEMRHIDLIKIGELL